MESRGLGTQFVPSHTMHHSALQTHRGTFIQSTMPTEWGWEGAATGYKGVGWSNRNGGKNWKNCVRVIRRGLMWGFVPLWSSWLHVQGWRLFWAPNDPFFLPPFYCFLPCVRVEQRPVLYLLSMILASVNAGCGHVSCAVHIKPVRLQCKHTVWMCGIYRVVWLSAFI